MKIERFTLGRGGRSAHQGSAQLQAILQVREAGILVYRSGVSQIANIPLHSPDFRQSIHVGFKIAAEISGRYRDALKANEAIIARNVTQNLFVRHLETHLRLILS